jgi:hypothetical protein
MERYCSTGQNPQRVVAPTEEEEVKGGGGEEEEEEEEEKDDDDDGRCVARNMLSFINMK